MRKEEIIVLEKVEDLLEFFGDVPINTALLFTHENPFAGTHELSKWQNYKLSFKLRELLAAAYISQLLDHAKTVTKKPQLVRDATRVAAMRRLAQGVDVHTSHNAILHASYVRISKWFRSADENVTADFWVTKFDFPPNEWLNYTVGHSLRYLANINKCA